MEFPLPSLTAAAAERVFGYLRIEDPLPERADLIVGFGHFDMRIPRRCGELWLRYGATILFTGGRGSGTADLSVPEADAFFAELKTAFPGIPDGSVILENGSTNTTENVRFSAGLLEKRFGKGFFGSRRPTVVICASP